MRLDDFSVEITQGHETPEGYVEMSHNQQYSILIKSNLRRRVAAVVKVDGKNVGTFRLPKYGHLYLERPAEDTGRFTFYKSGSNEAKSAGLNSVNRENLGLISVTFKPEKPESEEFEYTQTIDMIDWFPKPKSWIYPKTKLPDYKPLFCCGTSCHDLLCSYISTGDREVKSGGTGLSGKSHQAFRKVGNLDYDDPSTFRTIHLRLVCKKDDPRPLVEIKSTPVPKPI